MMFTTKMKYLVAVVLDKHADPVTKELLSLSLLHFVKISDLNTGLETKIHTVAPDISVARLSELRKRIESFLSIIKCYPETQKQALLEHFNPIELDSAEKKLDVIARDIQVMRDRQKTIQQEILKFEDISRQVLLFGDIKSSLKAGSQYSFLTFHTGIIPSPRLDEFKKEMESFPSVVLSFHEEDGKTYVLVITMKRDDAQINGLLDRFNFLDVEITEEMTGARDEVLATISKKKAELTVEQENLATKSSLIIEDNKEELLALWENLKLNELYNRIRSFFSKTSRTILFSGWVPGSRQKEIEEALKRVTEEHCYVEWRNPEGIEKEVKHKVNVPVQLKNLKALSPFQMLVTNYSIPEYGTIDPTPIVAILYFAMFGLMFADVGQGLIILLAGIFGTIFGHRFKEGMRQLVKLLIFCGAAAIVGGVLFGSYFGFELFPPLWFNFHGLVAGAHIPASAPVNNILQVLVITLYFGIAIIVLGLVLNWINLIRMRKWLKFIFDRTGLVGSWMYFGAVYTGYYFVTHNFRGVPDEQTLFFLLGLPGLLFFIKPVVDFIEHKKHNPALRFTPFTPFKFFFEWLLELLEFFIGYLSNTLSFMRVAGLGIAHVALMMAFTEIARMLGPNGTDFSVLSWIIYVIGNVFVIALEGLSAGIQALRLNYYEFFSKYFRGSGEAYNPVSLKSRN